MEGAPSQNELNKLHEEALEMDKEKESEKEALEKIDDIKEIFSKDLIWGDYRNKIPRRHYLKKIMEVRKDLVTATNYFHHLSSIDNIQFLKDPQLRSLSCYPFWMNKLSKYAPGFATKGKNGNDSSFREQ